VTWWHRLWRRGQMEEQLEKEMRFHLDQHAIDLIAHGRSPEEARRQARLAFGGPEQVKEECRDARGTRWLEDLWQDVRYAVRALRQRPGFAVVALLTLALGSGGTTVMFAVMNGVLLKPLSYPEPERLVALHEQTDTHGGLLQVAYPTFLDWERESRTLAPMAAWTYSGGTVSEPGDAEFESGREISPELFSVLGMPLIRGRAFLPDDDRPGAAPVVIISDHLWQRRFDRRSAAVGLPLVLDGRPYTIVGIAPAGFQLDGQVELFTPLGQNRTPRMQSREARFLHVLARLRPGVTMGEAQTELALIGHRLSERYPTSNAGVGLLALPLRQEIVGDVRPTLWLLFGAVTLVLLIACVNVASLLLARAVSRERELTMRVALGASRGRLVRQGLTESAVLALSGGMLGVLVAGVGTRPFLMLWPGSLPRVAEVRLDGRVLLFALAGSLVSGLLFGIAPAVRAPGRALDHTLRAGARSVAGGYRRLYAGFVTSEIALAVVLLVAAGMVGRTLLRLSALNPGVDIRNVLVTRLAMSPDPLGNPEQIRAAWQDVLDRARHVPGVRSVALTDIIPMRVGTNALGYWTTPAPPPPNTMPVALATTVTPDYLTVMGIPLRQGRFFNEQDRIGAEPVVVIDEVLARHAFGGQDPVGKRLVVQALGPSKVLGVVGHVRHWGLADDDQARVRDQIYSPLAQVPGPLLRLFSSFMSVAVRTNVPPLNLIEPLRRSIRGRSGDLALYEVRTMEQLADATLARQRFLSSLFSIFAGLALFLACIGLYGVLAYLTGQRVPEIGVRMALGASAADVIYLVLRQSLGMIVSGVAVGTLVAFAAGRVLEGLVQGIGPIEPSTFAIVIPLLMIAAVIASLVPARRASRVDPISALRQE
jgi:predicted permease